jgi:flagellar motor switch protein FliG
LPSQQAALLLERLLPGQAAALSDEVARIGSLSGDEQAAAIREFAAAAGERGGCAATTADHGLAARRRRPPEGGSGDLDPCPWGARRLRGDHRRVSPPFEFLGRLDPATIAALLADEHPQTVALVLHRLPSDLAAGVIDHLGPQKPAAVIRRIATMLPPRPEIVREVADCLRGRAERGPKRFVGLPPTATAGREPVPTTAADAVFHPAPVEGPFQEKPPDLFSDPVRGGPKPGVAPGSPLVPPGVRGGIGQVVKILNTMPPAAERQVLGRLAGADPDLLRDIRAAMFGANVAAVRQTANA